MQKHRITTNIGRDQQINVELKQEFDLLEILSLKFTQKEAYTSLCADYGVVCGRITINNGLGAPNAKVSIFIPLSEEDEDDPVISKLYPYKTISDKNEDNYRYNLLPSKKQHGGHEPTGTFPDQLEILNREEMLEVYEKYYKYTVKTNSSGDFMIWGVPIGEQMIHVDVDLSDMGCFSFQPYDLISLGIGESQFKNQHTFKISDDIDSLPQIIGFNKTIEVYPFWGNEDLCEISLTRTDFDLSERGVKIEPKAYLIGGTYTDDGKNSINKNCQPRRKMGRKCDLITKDGIIESIRFSNTLDEFGRPRLEKYEIDGEIDDDGSFFMEVPMNSEYLFTNEFGENEITNDPSKGIPTASFYRFRFELSDSGLDRTRTNADYLVPNIREYVNDKDKSYAFSLNWEDYPSDATLFNNNIIFNKEEDIFKPNDYFYRLNYNKVYTVSSFQSSYFAGKSFSSDNYLGIKEIVPTEEEDCSGDVLTPPVNFGVRNITFQLLLTDIFLFFEHIVNLTTMTFINTISRVLHSLANAVNFWPIKKLSKLIRNFAYRVQESGQRELFLVNYPECEECKGNNEYGIELSSPDLYCQVGELRIQGSESSSQRILNVTFSQFNTPNVGLCSSANSISNIIYFINNQTKYIISFNEEFSSNIAPNSFVYLNSQLRYNDSDGLFNEDTLYNVIIRDPKTLVEEPEPTVEIEEGCNMYDVPYDENIVEFYYTGTTPSNRVKVPAKQFIDGVSVVATQVGGDDGKYELIETYNGNKYTRYTLSGYSEFQDGIFKIIPGTQTNRRLWSILREFRRRKRVGTMFCGGIVNYSYIDNWLSGSLYFFQFKSKSKSSGERQKYCEDIVHYVKEQGRFYYRSTYFNNGIWGQNINEGNKRIGRPTTLVDLGPRDEFLTQICIDPSLDPSCSVVRSITPTSYQNFGEILGLAINYRMDVGDNKFDLLNFFDNRGNDFVPTFRRFVLDGDILQIISINNEVGIEEFDLQNPKYLGYTYELLDPDTYPEFFKINGPLPISLELSEGGERIRSCINEPGRLTESSQDVPFFLWDKKGEGFGNQANPDNQFWDYKNIEIQPLQGMTKNYKFVGGENDPSDKYLLLPMTQSFSGLTFVTEANTTDEIPFDVVDTNDIHTNFRKKYQGFTFLHVTDGTISNPIVGFLYVRVGPVGFNSNIVNDGWYKMDWNYLLDFIIKPTEINYQGTTQILSTPFQFYFGLRPGRTGLDKFIKYFGPNRPIVD